MADELLDERLRKVNLSAADRALATELFYGVLRNNSALEFLVSELAAKRPPQRLATILQLGLYQLFFLERIPEHAAVNEIVELAKKYTSAAEARFVNATLRRAVEERNTLRAKLQALCDSEPWVYFSHPRWLWERWRGRWGEADAANLCAWNNEPPSIYVRLNTLKTSTLPSDIEAEPSSFHPLCWKLTGSTQIFHTESWAKGALYVQDPSTLLAVDVLNPQTGESVLDMCAAPGGKTTYIAEKMQDRGQIIAVDESSGRLERVGENCKRLGITIVAAIACTGTRLGRRLRGRQFDRVLVVARCCNTGVLRRRADLRWRIEEKEINRLASLQQRLLQSVAALTGPSGVLVYSTCSLEPEENEAVVEAFRKTHPRFELETVRSTFPPRDGVDGAFVARFRRG